MKLLNSTKKDSKIFAIDDPQILEFLKKEHGQAANFILEWAKQTKLKDKITPSTLGKMIILHKNQTKLEDIAKFLALSEEIEIDLKQFFNKKNLSNQISANRGKNEENKASNSNHNNFL